MQPRELYLGVASKNLQKDLSARGLYLTLKKTHDVGFFTCQVQCPGFTIPGQKPKVRMGEVQSPRLPTCAPGAAGGRLEEISARALVAWPTRAPQWVKTGSGVASPLVP